MKVLGHEFTEMTKTDWQGYAGAEPGTLICHLEDGDLLYDPSTRTIIEIRADEESFGQFNWRAEQIF